MEKDLLNVQVNKIDDFNYVFTQVKTTTQYYKELQELYDNHYKKNYEMDGFRKGEVPFKIAMANGMIASQILELVARVNRQILVEEIIKEIGSLGSIYDIKDGDNQTDFAAFDLNDEAEVIFELNAELASFVDEVDYEKIQINKEDIKTKEVTEEELNKIYLDYKKVKEQVKETTNETFVDLKFDDGTDETTLTFDLSTEPEDNELKKKTHRELSEKLIGRTIGDIFDYSLTGEDGKELEVKVTVMDIYKVRVMEDEEFLETINETQEKKVTLEEVKEMFKSHIEEEIQANIEEEIRSLTFDALFKLTKGIHYNEREIEDLQNQFIAEVARLSTEEKKSYDDYVKENFVSIEHMTDYIRISQKTKILNAAIYRKIGKSLDITPTYPQLEAFVKAFILRLDPRVELTKEQLEQVNAQVEVILGEPLNRQRVIDGWYTAKAEDVVEDIVREQIK